MLYLREDTGERDLKYVKDPGMKTVSELVNVSEARLARLSFDFELHVLSCMYVVGLDGCALRRLLTIVYDSCSG
jgi:hypothetical protein